MHGLSTFLDYSFWFWVNVGVLKWIRSISDDVENRFCCNICPRNGAFCKKTAEIDKNFLFPCSIT